MTMHASLLGRLCLLFTFAFSGCATSQPPSPKSVNPAHPTLSVDVELANVEPPTGPEQVPRPSVGSGLLEVRGGARWVKLNGVRLPIEQITFRLRSGTYRVVVDNDQREEIVVQIFPGTHVLLSYEDRQFVSLQVVPSQGAVVHSEEKAAGFLEEREKQQP